MGLLLALILIPLVSSLITYLIGIKREDIASYFAVLVTFVNLLVSGYIALIFDYTKAGFQFEETYPWLTQYGISMHLGIDGLSLMLIILSTFLSFIAAWASLYQIEHKKALYFAVFLLFEVGIIGTFAALNLIAFYVFWELVLVPMFFLIGEWGPNRERARYSAIKFFIYTHVGSVLMLVGFIYAFLQVGSFDFIAIAEGMKGLKEAQVIVTALVFFGFAFKLPAVPFHTWLPDAHVEAPAPVSVLLAGLLLKMGGYGFLRTLWLFPEGVAEVGPLVLLLAVISILYSAFVAMRQKDVKRLIAYSSINHMGYVLFVWAMFGTFMKLGLEQFTSEVTIAVIGASIELFGHGVSIGLLFLLSGVIHHYLGTRNVDVLYGLSKNMPKTSALFMIGGLAAGGIPGTIGFVGEALVFLGTLGILLKMKIWWGVLIVFGPVVVMAYFIWITKNMYFHEGNVEVSKVPSIKELLPLAVLVIPIILLGVYPEPLLVLVRKFASMIVG